MTHDLAALREALEPFVALADKRDAVYRKRGGNPDAFPDTHPAYDVGATELPVGVWRAARQALAALEAPAVEGDKDEDETYEIGARDGYEKAVQEIDMETGGDGEYRYCTDHDPERHCPDAATMKARIVERFAARQPTSSAVEVANVLLREIHEAMAVIMQFRRSSTTQEQRDQAHAAIQVWRKVQAHLAEATARQALAALEAPAVEGVTISAELTPTEKGGSDDRTRPNPLLGRAYECVRHSPECAGIGMGDEHCDCDAVAFLRDLEARLRQPLAATRESAAVEREREEIRRLKAENENLSRHVASGVLGTLLEDDETTALLDFLKTMRAAAAIRAGGA